MYGVFSTELSICCADCFAFALIWLGVKPPLGGGAVGVVLALCGAGGGEPLARSGF